MPATSSRTVRTIWSTFFCTLAYSRMPRREISITPIVSSGSVAISTRLSRKSIISVTSMPPSSNIGARTPRR